MLLYASLGGMLLVVDVDRRISGWKDSTACQNVAQEQLLVPVPVFLDLALPPRWGMRDQRPNLQFDT